MGPDKNPGPDGTQVGGDYLSVQMGPDKSPGPDGHRSEGVIYGSRWVQIKIQVQMNTGRRGLYMGPSGPIYNPLRPVFIWTWIFIWTHLDPYITPSDLCSSGPGFLSGPIWTHI